MPNDLYCPCCGQVRTLRTRKDTSGRLFVYCTHCQPDMFVPEQLTLPLGAPLDSTENEARTGKEAR